MRPYNISLYVRSVAACAVSVVIVLTFLPFLEDVGMGARTVKGNDSDFGILLI